MDHDEMLDRLAVVKLWSWSTEEIQSRYGVDWTSDENRPFGLLLSLILS